MHQNYRKLIIFSLLFLIFPFLIAAAVSGKPIAPKNDSGAGVLAWGSIVIGLFGGLAFFLYGMEMMSAGMKKTAGNRMRSILAALTKNRVIALFVGAFFTMTIQSSSATTVMLVGFVNAQLMQFSQTIGVILGAGIGTTITAQLIAFKLTDYALVMIIVGFFVQLIAPKNAIRHLGNVLFGFGILFYGMKLMSDAMIPLRSYPSFIDIFRSLENPIMGILFGAVFTALVQSSSAAIGIVIVLAQQGFITLSASVPLIFGANIGTCVTAFLAAISASRDAKCVAVANIIFRIVGVLLFVFWIPDFVDIIEKFSGLFGFDVARQIANAHTMFNVGTALVFLPFTVTFAKIIDKIIPAVKTRAHVELTTWHLDDNCIRTPALAIDLARAEISRMAKLLNRMLRAIIIPFMSDERLLRTEVLEEEEAALLIREIPKQDEYFPKLTLLEGIDLREEKIDFLEEKIGEYLIKLAGQDISKAQVTEIYGMVSIIKDMESIGDIIHRNMVPLIQKKKNLKMDFSKEGKEELMIYHNKVTKQIQLLRESFAERDLVKARRIMQKERKYLDLESRYRVLHLERILHAREESVETHEIHMELMDLLKQIVVYSSNIAKTYLDATRESVGKRVKSKS